MWGPALGVGAWGLVTGVAMVKSGMSVPMALLMSLLLLYLAAPLFARLPVRAGWALVALCALACTMAAEAMTGWAIEDMKAWPVREALWALLQRWLTPRA